MKSGRNGEVSEERRGTRRTGPGSPRISLCHLLPPPILGHFFGCVRGRGDVEDSFSVRVRFFTPSAKLTNSNVGMVILLTLKYVIGFDSVRNYGLTGVIDILGRFYTFYTPLIFLSLLNFLVTTLLC